MIPLDYQTPHQHDGPYRPHRPWFLGFISVVPVVLLLAFARVRTTQFQRQVGREVLNGTMQDGQFQRMSDRIFVAMFALEGVLFVTTAVMVVLRRWHPSAAGLLLVYIAVSAIGMFYLASLGFDASP